MRPIHLITGLFIILFAGTALAAQSALVIAEKAIVYSDEYMSSPLGYLPQGKKIKVGEIPKNNGQVYAIIISGKKAFIKVSDVTTEKESVDSDRLLAERFTTEKTAHLRYRYSAALFYYGAQVTLPARPGGLQNNDSLGFLGLGLKKEVASAKYWDIQVIGNYLGASEAKESFRIFELGFGTAYRFMEWRRILLRAEGQLLVAPYARYDNEVSETSAIGFTGGLGLNASKPLSSKWSVEGFAGFYYSSFSGFSELDPVFKGTRIGAGMTYTY